MVLNPWIVHVISKIIVVKKIVPRRNPGIVCVNRPLHMGTSFVVLYIVSYRPADVNILGSTHSLQ